MLRLLASLFAFLDKLLGMFRDSKLEERGRQQAKEKLDENVAKAEEAVATPDPARDERLRSRFDRSRQATTDK